MLLSVFQVSPGYGEEGAPVLIEEGKHTNKLGPKFPFHYTDKHYERGTDVYVWKKDQLGAKDVASFDRLTAFVMGIPLVQCMGRGEKPIFDKYGKAVFDLGLIGVKELLEIEDTAAYLGSRFYDLIFFVQAYSSILLTVLCCFLADKMNPAEERLAIMITFNPKKAHKGV